MNKLLDRVIKIEYDIEELIEDVYSDVEYCEFNKKDILKELTIASDALGEAYKLNKRNFPDKSRYEN